ncbi:MAG TPA: formate/nitrite transporter family protein [Pseudoflavonifractor sp.]|nr:formate/nitrite transporter family protein [Pseudoflavonifractor sp.]
MTRTDISAIAETGVGKAALSGGEPLRYLARASLAGGFIFVGALLSCLSAAWFYADYLPVAKLLGAVSFSAALILIVLLGGELFTGSNLVMGVSLYEGKVPVTAALRVWALCYIGNFIGIFVLCLLLVGSGAVKDLLSSYLALTVPGKLASPWYALFLKGVLCNFLVCVGTFSGFRLKSEAGKVIAITLAITTFVLAGFEHSVANMAYFGLYALYFGPSLLPAMGWSMLWVTLGNLLGGAVLLGLPLWCAAERRRD